MAAIVAVLMYINSAYGTHGGNYGTVYRTHVYGNSLSSVFSSEFHRACSLCKNYSCKENCLQLEYTDDFKENPHMDMFPFNPFILNTALFAADTAQSDIDSVKKNDTLDQNSKAEEDSASEDRETVRDKSTLLMIAELAIVLLLGKIIYYINGETNKKDYRYSADETFSKRFTTTDTLQFDTNPVATNALSHPLAGSLYYLIGRSNGFNSIESFGIAFAASLVWEYFCEYREITSINDMIFTPVTGLALGESVYQYMALFAAYDPGGYFGDFVDNWMLGGTNYYKGSLAGKSSVWNDMQFFAGGGSTDDASPFFTIGLDFEMYGIRRFNQNGTISGLFYNGPYARLKLNTKLDDGGVKDLQIYAETSLLAYVNQRMTHSAAVKTGHTIFIGLNSAYEYRNYILGDFEDETGIAHIAGPIADLFLNRGNLQFRIRTALFGDFACMPAYGLEPWFEAGNTDDDLRDRGAYVTAEHGYYYAYGTTFDGLISLLWNKFEAGGQIIYNYYKSMNVPQDTYPVSDNPVKMKDERTDIKAWFKYYLPSIPCLLKLDFNRKILEGYADQYHRSGSENLFYGSIVYKLFSK